MSKSLLDRFMERGSLTMVTQGGFVNRQVRLEALS
jgi:hypothetical protein